MYFLCVFPSWLIPSDSHSAADIFSLNCNMNATLFWLCERITVCIQSASLLSCEVHCAGCSAHRYQWAELPTQCTSQGTDGVMGTQLLILTEETVFLSYAAINVGRKEPVCCSCWFLFWHCVFPKCFTSFSCCFDRLVVQR